ncbi:LOW QUALITY PROTEIN: ADAM DEC1 [Suncus etruscus]|uniref:LOW QUALITY PROTEIN: ADAM DEC1 n=1 Tax=Suncus etruscus TaxID=109475 RepID=UPI00211088DC|nr:LOW QUALITY PROTEIN: ADAM DEC1 [Suncus etruscus]
MPLILLSIFCLIIPTQAIVMEETPESKYYEVVHPKKLHILHKRELQNNQKEKLGREETYDPEIQYQIKIKGEEVILYLQKTKNLLGPDYSETYYSPTGEEVTTRPKDMDHCYYEGHIINEKNTVASISTCHGLRGYFTHHDQKYMIKPLKSTDEEDHAVLTNNQEDLDSTNYTCGKRNVGSESLLRTARSLNSPGQNEFLQADKYIDLFLVLDNAFYNNYNRNLTMIRSFVFEVMNLLNVIYKTLNIQVVLVGMEIWSNGDKIEVVPNAGNTFSNFLNWHRSNLRNQKLHDHIQLLSGINFKKPQVGLAASNSLCSSSSIAVIEAKNKNSVSLVGIMAHELGHVLGMPAVHYFYKVPLLGSCVMESNLSSKFPKDFSTISHSRFEKFILSKKPKCLLQAPNPKSIMPEPVCGNKLLESEKDCDSGSPKECTNLCCETETCKFKPGNGCGGTLNHLKRLSPTRRLCPGGQSAMNREQKADVLNLGVRPAGWSLFRSGRAQPYSSELLPRPVPAFHSFPLSHRICD